MHWDSDHCVGLVFQLLNTNLPWRLPFLRGVGCNEMSLSVKAEGSFILEEKVTSLQPLHPTTDMRLGVKGGALCLAPDLQAGQTAASSSQETDWNQNHSFLAMSHGLTVPATRRVTWRPIGLVCGCERWQGSCLGLSLF